MGEVNQTAIAALRTAREAIDRALATLTAPAPSSPSPAILEPLAWGAKVSPLFRDRVRVFGKDFSADPNWFMACMAFETIETFSPAIRPKRKDGTLISSAVGLIQFLDKTARALGTTTDALAKMTPEKQLDYVWLYFRDSIRQFGPIRNLGDCYMHIHWPTAVGKADSDPMYLKGTPAYNANVGLDLNHDSVITRAEAVSLVMGKLAKGLKPEYRA